MANLSAEAKVGLLVIVGSAALLYMTLLVGKYQFGEQKGYLLQATFDSVAGIDAKASVRMAGVKIGTVEKVELEDSRAVVTMRIAPHVRIRRGTQVMVKSMGLLGEKYVEFVPRKPHAPQQPSSDEAAYYRGGDRVEATISPSDIDRLINQLSAVADDIKLVTGSLAQVLGTESGTRSMQDILQDLRQATANIREFSGSLRTEGGELVMQLNELAASLQEVVGENRANLRVTMENVREASKNAEMALVSIENTARKIDQGEGTLGKLVNDEGMYQNIDTAARGLGDYVSRVERLKTVVAFRGEYMFPDAKSYATLELKPRPDTSYILEITSDPFGKYNRTVTTTTDTAGASDTVVTETFEDKLQFSIEYAKRWGNLALRLGLIESTGGVAADYYAFDDRLKFSLDSWNYGSKESGNENVHLKAAASYSLGRTFFVNAGYDNFLNSRRATPFAGLGLRFDDEDLKYLLGSVPVP
jgi:phospholipid/cholesterol/gamma-HCH transport system substrate-binding protein